MPNNYSIVRCNNNKMQLKIENDKAVVYAPYWLTEQEIDSFVSRHKTWINNRINKPRKAISLEMIDGNTITILDKEYTLILKNSAKNCVDVYQDTIIVNATSKQQQKKVYYYFLYNKLDEIVQSIKQKHHFSFYDDYKFYKGKWGCCYPKKNLVILNLYVICLPVELIDAIICHEYTHFKFQNHQKQFYQQLYKYCPRYDDLNKKLKEYQIKK